MMEFSSPLATMQPHAPHFGPIGEDWRGWQYHFNQPGHKSTFSGSFNFEGLTVKEPSTDYFNSRPVRGSSPTSTLVADLSQNLLIDQRYDWPCQLHRFAKSLIAPGTLRLDEHCSPRFTLPDAANVVSTRTSHDDDRR